MNWTGFPYSCDPVNYKLAFDRIRSIFVQEGVPAESVRWVFAPNGLTGCSGHSMATYYPGDSKIDLIAISAYNYGYHPSNPYPGWSTPEETFGAALQEAYTLAPSKPIFIGQTGTTAYASPGVTSVSAKNNWLSEAYGTLPGYANVRGVIYFNALDVVDWAFYLEDVLAYTGYVEGIQNNYAYLSPATLKNFDLINGR
jgi:beta-mannanase